MLRQAAWASTQVSRRLALWVFNCDCKEHCADYETRMRSFCNIQKKRNENADTFKQLLRQRNQGEYFFAEMLIMLLGQSLVREISLHTRVYRPWATTSDACSVGWVPGRDREWLHRHETGQMANGAPYFSNGRSHQKSHSDIAFQQVITRPTIRVSFRWMLSTINYLLSFIILCLNHPA